MSDSEQTSNAAKYWWAKLRLLLGILAIWFIVSFGCGIIFRDWLETVWFEPKLGLCSISLSPHRSAPLGHRPQCLE